MNSCMGTPEGLQPLGEGKAHQQRQRHLQIKADGYQHFAEGFEIGEYGAPAGEQVAVYPGRILKGGGPEEHDAACEQQVCTRHLEKGTRGPCAVKRVVFFHLFAPACSGFSNAHVNAIQKPPHHIGEAGTMPQAACEEHDDLVQILAEFTLSVAAEGNVQIIAEPVGEADMPAPPQFGKAVRGQRAAEIFHQADAEHLARADGDIRTGGKITV